METKRLVSNVLNTVAAAGANVNVDDIAAQYCICTNNAAPVLTPILPPIPYRKTRNLVFLNSQTEQVQYTLLDAQITNKETIVANQRYSIKIGNTDLRVFSTTAPAVLSGNPFIDRANVYTILAARINAYARLGASAAVIHSVNFTAGAVEPNPDIVATQAISGVTARIVRISLTSGAWAASTAAGTAYISFASNDAAILGTAIAWTWAGGGTLTQTIGTIVMTTGIAVRDEAGYFTSFRIRSGINYVHTVRGFVNRFEITRAGRYAIGIGSIMALLGTMQYDHTRMNLLGGDIDFELIHSGAFDVTRTYRKYILDIEGGDVDTRAFSSIAGVSRVVLWVDESNVTNLGAFDSALRAAIVR